jgi:putative two-component system protein, hydrogenase maturation factor HypX/HoxX
MKLLLLSTAYNGLTQRAHLELQAAGHDVYLELAVNDKQMMEAVALIKPELILCPFLKTKLPEAIWHKTRTVILHPGIVGDRGPSSLDWAIHHGEKTWGVTALEASEDFDAGDIWATETFTMRNAPKASLYRQEVTDAAINCILKTVKKVQAGEKPLPLSAIKNIVKGRLRPLMTQAERTIDWQHDSTREIIRKIHAGDSFPGVLSEVCGLEVYLYGAHEEGMYRGKRGDIITQRDGAICIATTDSAVWISHLRQRGSKDKRYLKLPATKVLGERSSIPEEFLFTYTKCKYKNSYHEIWYDEAEEVGYLHFDFHNGAMSTEQCQRLRRAFQWAKTRPTKIITLVGGEDFHSNGIHLNMIEAADDPAFESWRNINAINDLILEILTCASHLTVSAVRGNAGAGGVIFALACDYVVARSGRIFNPHYKTMGLHGSEYWTYVLPKRIGEAAAYSLTESCLPISAETAFELGLVDKLIDARGTGFMAQLATYFYDVCEPTNLPTLLESKQKAIPSEAMLEQHRHSELSEMQKNFSSAAYTAARKAFVYKQAPTETPIHLARHWQLEREVA